MAELARADFIEMEGTTVRAVYCKLCGTQIAGIVERLKGDPQVGRNGERVITKVERYSNFANFSELKMACSDGSAHITTGCASCLTHDLTKEQLRAMMYADIDEQAAQLGEHRVARYKGREPLTIIGIRQGGGIV